MTGFFQEVLQRYQAVLLSLLSAEQHFLCGYKVPDQSPVPLSEQTFLINLKSLITPFFNKGSGVTFFLSSKLIDSNMPGSCFAANTWEHPSLKQTTLQWGGIQYRKGLWTNRDEQTSLKLSFLSGSLFVCLFFSCGIVFLLFIWCDGETVPESTEWNWKTNPPFQKETIFLSFFCPFLFPQWAPSTEIDGVTSFRYFYVTQFWSCFKVRKIFMRTDDAPLIQEIPCALRARK